MGPENERFPTVSIRLNRCDASGPAGAVNRPAVSILGYRVSSAGLRGDVQHAWDLLGSRSRVSYMACANPHSLVVASKDLAFQEALRDATILIPDGSGLILAARVLRLPLVERVAGYEFFIALSELAEKNDGLDYFFLGSSEPVLQRIKSRLSVDFPGIRVCGAYSPPFREEFTEDENLHMIEAINSARPDVLWVGMTAPKQEKWIHKNKERLGVPFVGAIGAAFDYYGGAKKRPGPFWQKLGMEFLPRFFREPKRLWERNMRSTPVFLGWVARERLRQFRTGRKPAEQ